MPNQYTIYKQIPHICYACGSDKTSSNGRGSPNWLLNLPTESMLCHYCYDKIIHHPKVKKNIHSRLLRFKGKQILLPEPIPRKHICSKCGKEGYTHMHHTEYDHSSPLNNTIELCPSCHIKETWKEWKCLRTRERKT